MSSEKFAVTVDEYQYFTPDNWQQSIYIIGFQGRLRQFDSGPGVDLLKVDVEGEEYEVLRGIDAGDWPRIRQIVAEVHDKKGRLQQVTRLLEDKGFTVGFEKRQQLPSTFVDIYHVYAVR